MKKSNFRTLHEASYLNEPALHVSGLGRLDGRVYQPLTSSHRVEEELRGREAAVETVLNKPSRRWVLGWNRQKLLSILCVYKN